MSGALLVAIASCTRVGASAVDSPLPELAVGAAVDLSLLEQTAPNSETGTAALAARLEVGVTEVRRAVLAANRDGDPQLEAPAPFNAALLLRLRTLEALATASGEDLEGARFAARAESLESALRLQQDELRSDITSLLPVAAGLRPSRAEARRVLPALEAVWQNHCDGRTGDLDGATAYLLLHTFEPGEAASLARMWRPVAGDVWDAAIADLGAGRSHLVAADDPARRLELAVRLLVHAGVVPPAVAVQARRAVERTADTPELYAAAAAALDSLADALDSDAPRASPILGSRHDYYRRTGDVAPILGPADEALARAVGRRAAASLRARLDRQVLARLGVLVGAEVQPVEIVPGQLVAATWTLATPSETRFVARRASISNRLATVRDPTVEVLPGSYATVRTGYVGLQRSTAGTILSLDLVLSGSIDGWGDVVLRDRVTVRVVAPVQASMGPVGDPLLDGGRKSITAIVTSRAPHPVRGTLRVLATSDWKIEPARMFRFSLLRPGQSARTQIDVDLPSLASPGPYELLVRLEVDDQPIGTLGTRLVKPIEWVVVGPFAPPRPGRSLPPEQGVSLGARYKGADGRQIAWQVAPRDAYDPDGGLDLEALFPDPTQPFAACALTVLESPEVAPATLRVTGATRVLWNGEPLAADGQVRLERGRNTLLVRTNSSAAGWRLLVELQDVRGEPLRLLANDLARLLDGYADLEKTPTAGPDGQPSDRVVVVEFVGPGPATEVAVLGSFNAWVPLGLERQPDGSWRRELRLAPGRYAYKLLVDGLLRPDPSAPTSEPDGFGGRNSLLIVR